MSLQQFEAAAAAVNGVGNKLEDQFEMSKVELGEARGIRSGFDFATRKIEALSLALDAAFKAEPPTVTEDEYRFGKKYFGIVAAHLMELTKNAGEQVFRVQGKVATLENTVKLVGGMLKAEEGKIAAIKSGVLVEESSGRLPGQAPGDASVTPIRQPGQHPGNPIAALHARGEEPPPRPRRGGRRKKE